MRRRPTEDEKERRRIMLMCPNNYGQNLETQKTDKRRQEERERPGGGQTGRISTT